MITLHPFVSFRYEISMLKEMVSFGSSHKWWFAAVTADRPLFEEIQATIRSAGWTFDNKAVNHDFKLIQ